MYQNQAETSTDLPSLKKLEIIQIIHYQGELRLHLALHRVFIRWTGRSVGLRAHERAVGRGRRRGPVADVAGGGGEEEFGTGVGKGKERKE